MINKGLRVVTKQEVILCRGRSSKLFSRTLSLLGGFFSALHVDILGLGLTSLIRSIREVREAVRCRWIRTANRHRRHGGRRIVVGGGRGHHEVVLQRLKIGLKERWAYSKEAMKSLTLLDIFRVNVRLGQVLNRHKEEVALVVRGRVHLDKSLLMKRLQKGIQ